MERIRRLAGMGKAKVPSVIQAEDKDESVVFFRELNKREKYRDVNLLEPMYSVEFDAIQGGHVCRVPSGKRDFLIPVDEKHDYDWLMTPPTAPLFPSLDSEANSSRMVFQKEVPIPPRPVKPSRLSGKPDGATKLARPTSHTASSSAKTTCVKGAPAVSKEKKQPRTADQRPSHKATPNGKQKAAAAAIPGTRASSGAGAPKKHSERCYASQASGTSTVKGVADQEVPYKAPKNLITTARSIFRRQAPPPAVSAQSKGAPAAVSAQSKGPGSSVDVKKKKKNGKAARQPCPPAATRGMTMTELQLQDRRNELPPRGTHVAGSGAGGEPASSTGGRAGRAALLRAIPKADGRAWI
ncbi:hypothetical protein BDA96_07G195200 [Sorghum bicolor]|uniref:Uncharacterized protein n=2 Tax=Sorghum bicolor TaxID=4558 RepID=A0A921QP71_SORBI|nr:uncharacterized protein LOC8060901 isoform X2 [Sorghum bicolor]XP_021321098.1 uncharacterized protein LOC8060901 isoform X2 [Sorghum bicolor]EES14144.1 hypothetical protein SORBI_3007G183600 [Sorghum bicolor]KAG0524257.1 hypothetical protein BDA96_07G195200 [Sorghum bicolor]|eukprot:XP_002444649.1 uncharacterized protein LOC8060901 isoform X2 [Sorghum bicolor]